MLKYFSEVRVRYADTDQMRFVYNGKYFEYFEVGRTEMMREQNLTYKQIEENGYYPNRIYSYDTIVSIDFKGVIDSLEKVIFNIT